MSSFIIDRIDSDEVLSRIMHQKRIEPSILNSLGPSTDLFTQNPFSIHIACMALAQGRRFVHHELRGYLPVPPDMEPEISVWEYEQNTPMWIGGVRRNPKHFCFRLDAVFPTFHPNYRSKWPVHELLHSLCGYFWHPEQTRFECYVGARLAELLPLAHWYGLDEVARNRCVHHTQKPPSKEYCRTCESMFDAYWQTEWNKEQYVHSHKALDFALAYYQEEREACVKELQSNRRVEIPRVLLDSSSDALGYLEGHWNRLCSWSFGAFDDLFVREEERHSSLEEFVVHIDGVFAKLLEGNISIPELDVHRSEYQVRQVQDLGKRVLVALEWGTQEDQKSCWPLLVQAADSIHHDQSLHFDEWTQEIQKCLNATTLPQEVLEPLFQTGTLSGHSSPSIYKGIEQSFDSTLHDLQPKTLVDAKAFWSLGHLWERLPKIIEHEAISLEGWLKKSPHEDRQARLFSMPFSNETGTMRLSSTFRRGRFSKEAMLEVLGWGEEADIIAWWNQGNPFVLVVDDELEICLSSLKKGDWREINAYDYLEELVSIGLLVWIPTRRSQ